MNDLEYMSIKQKVLKLTKLDLDGYKADQLRRRLDGYVSRSGSQDISAYCRLLDRDADVLKKLIDYIAINVSEFFRDTPQFGYLRNTVLPQLLQRSGRLNIWSAACSCGQEAYSLAMILAEIDRTGRKHRILATDIDESALEQAAKGGPYPLAEVKNLEKSQMRFFRHTPEGYWVSDSLREKVEFRRQNLLCDGYERGFDLIVCRNAIIYFSDKVRDELYARFNSSLKPGGVLFTGGSEIILRPDSVGFSLIHPSFYRKKTNE